MVKGILVNARNWGIYRNTGVQKASPLIRSTNDKVVLGNLKRWRCKVEYVGGVYNTPTNQDPFRVWSDLETRMACVRVVAAMAGSSSDDGNNVDGDGGRCRRQRQRQR